MESVKRFGKALIRESVFKFLKSKKVEINILVESQHDLQELPRNTTEIIIKNRGTLKLQ